MDFESLNDYHEKEREQYDSFIKSTPQNQLLSKEYPSRSRFPKLHDFITYATVGPGESIWIQAPYTGSLLVPLVPTQTLQEFEQLYGISKSQIPEIVDFVKETGKIQFYLEGCPEDYVNRDYLDPIFSELNPPVLFSNEPYLKDPEIMRAQLEFYDLLSCVDFNTYIKRLFPDLSPAKNKKILEHFLKSFIRMRYYKFDTIADSFADNVALNTEYAFSLLRLSNQLLTEPLSRPLKGNHNYSTGDIYEFKQVARGENSKYLNQFQYPCEIGTYLTNKKINYPDSFDSCRSMVYHYDEKELRLVFDAISTGIHEKKPDQIFTNITELNQILEEIWSETRTVQAQKKIIKGELSVMFGLVGVALPQEIGWMASLGLIVASSSSNFMDELSDLITKKSLKPYLSTIYAFEGNSLV
ncbi:MAG: hypothetical protein PHO85_07265 [Candidatus Cloacimonetes bacterium]|jgi:hypothetical protein|nr:hypothetical protein [Candidatus Cloacimonadota bacterium]MDD4484766.1 hypothetical protein [Methanoregula sp.]